MAFTLVVVVGPGTRAGQAAWALGGSGHVEGVSLGRGRKARCGGPRDAGWARQKPWSQQTLVSPRLWLKGNQMLPASGLSLPAAPLLAVPHSESLPLPCGSCGEPPGGASHHHTHLQSMVGAQWPSEASPPAPSPTASSPRCQALLLSCFLLLSSASRPHLTHCG